MMGVHYRRARVKDYGSIARLNAANFVTHLAPQEREEGFLSAVFTEAQIAAIAAQLGIMVAVVNDQVAGFLCAFRKEFDHGSPVVAEMLAAYDRLMFEGRPLSGYNSYVYGPVCIDRPFRHKGLLRGLFEAQKKDLTGYFELGVALISRRNVHSFAAHTLGLGMSEVGEFEVNGERFATVAFRLG